MYIYVSEGGQVCSASRMVYTASACVVKVYAGDGAVRLMRYKEGKERGYSE